MNHAVLRLAVADANVAMRALEPDDGGHMDSRVEDGVLVLRAESATAMGLLRSLDDALACLRALGDD